MKNNDSCLPIIGFPHKVNNIRIEKPISIPSLRLLNSNVSDSSNRISKFYDPTASEKKFYKTEVENLQPMETHYTLLVYYTGDS